MLKYDQLYITADCESEGLNLYYSRPWQVSWVEHQGTKFIKEFDLYVDIPDLNIPKEVQKMTGFNQKKYDELKQPPKEVYSILKSRLLNPKYKIIGQNLLTFDIFMINQLQAMAGEEQDSSYINRIYDTLAFGRAYKNGIEKPSSGNLTSWQFKILNDPTLRKKRVNLEQQLKDFGIDYDPKNLHDSLWDVRYCKEVFEAQRKVMNL